MVFMSFSLTRSGGLRVLGLGFKFFQQLLDFFRRQPPVGLVIDHDNRREGAAAEGKPPFAK